jgi:hypothetical protein
MAETAITQQSVGQVGGTGIVLRDFEQMYRFSKAICASRMVPNGLDTPEKVLVTLQYGMELGMKPMQALQSIYVVNNKPTLYGDGFLAQLKSSKEWDEDQFKEWFTGKPFNDDFTAHCQMGRRGRKEPMVAEFSVADAKMGDLWAKKTSSGKKTPWCTAPRRMLMMRARTFCGRDLFADVLKGMTSTEEAMDFIDVDTRDVTAERASSPPPPAAKPTRGVAAAVAAVVGSDPDPADEPSPAPPPDDDTPEEEEFEIEEQQSEEQSASKAARDEDERDRLIEELLMREITAPFANIAKNRFGMTAWSFKQLNGLTTDQLADLNACFKVDPESPAGGEGGLFAEGGASTG